ARVAASMSTMLPERMPSAGWWPMPTTRSPWPSTRATKHTTLLVPISSAATTPFLVFATMSPVSLLTLRWSCRPRRRRVGLAAFPEIELVRHPEIDDAELAAQELVLTIELDQLLERRHRVLFRQPDLDVVVQNQVPAPLADPHRGAQLLGHRRLVGEQQQE